LLERVATSADHLLAMPGFHGLQNIHPLIVHFPIALLSAALLVFWLSWLARHEAWGWTGLWLLGLGTLSALVAVWTGLQAGNGVMIAPSVREHILEHHEHYMLTILALSIILTAWAWLARPLPRRGRIGFLVLMLLMVAILVKGADYGGWMVFGYNAGGSLPQPIEFSQ
jgi:uncharacterized membrane protein